MLPSTGHGDAILDHDKINELRVLEAMEFQSIIQHYRLITPHLMQNLAAAITQQEISEIARLSMRLRSSSMQMGAVQFAALASSIEYFAVEQNLNTARMLFILAAQHYPNVSAALKAVGAPT